MAVAQWDELVARAAAAPCSGAQHCARPVTTIILWREDGKDPRSPTILDPACARHVADVHATVEAMHGLALRDVAPQDLASCLSALGLSEDGGIHGAVVLPPPRFQRGTPAAARPTRHRSFISAWGRGGRIAAVAGTLVALGIGATPSRLLFDCIYLGAWAFWIALEALLWLRR